MKAFTAYHLLDEIYEAKFDRFRANVNENNITHLNLSGKVKNRNLKLVGEALKGTHILYADLSENKISAQGVKDFTEFLKDTKITYIDLSANKIDAQGAKDLGESLKGTKVTHVDLSYNEIGSQGVKGFGETLKGTQVIYVHLNNNEIDAQGAKDFAECLKGTKVTHVDLRENKIGLQGAKDFIEALKGTQVTYIGLNYNKIGPQGVKDLGEALKDIPITHIDLRFNIINAQSAEDFARCIPYTLLLNVRIDKAWEPYISEAVQSNIAKYIHTPYYLIALKLLPEKEKDKCKNIKKEALSTTKGQLRYACGILLHPLLPQEIFNHIYSFLPLASKKENIISTYLDWAKYYRLRNAFGEWSHNVPYQPQKNKYILNQYRLQPKADLPVQPVFAETLNKRWKKDLLL